MVNGILRALGTRESPVVFKPAVENAAGWGGIYFEDTIEGSEFVWTHIEGSNSSGLHLVRSNPTLDYVTFRGNSASDGGGLFVELHDRNLHLNNCLFVNNYADTAGGAIYAVGPTGSDDAVLVVSECVFLQNSAGTTDTGHNTRGGALNIQGNSRISRSTFRRNEAQAYTIYAAGGRYTKGGAIFAGEGRTEIIATVFFANACRMRAHGQTPDSSRAYGGAIFQNSGELLLSNSVVTENVLSVSRHPDRKGSGLYVAGGINSIVNTTMAANSHHAVYRNGGDIEILNSILFFNNNGGAQISDSSNTLIATYSDIQNGFDGEGNIAFDPIFDEYFRIVSPSPAIDAGDPNLDYYDVSPPGQGGPRNDMGATGGPAAVFSATADAGPDQDVDERTTVTLDGTRSIDMDGGSLNYSWRQIEGPVAILSSSTAVQPSFPAEEVTEPTTLTFQLVVNGGDADSAPVTVNINVHDVNRTPTADAGLDQDVDECMSVTLDGTGSSDPDGDSLSYSWRQTAGPDAVVPVPSNAQLTLEASLITELTTLTFELVVNDGNMDSLPDTVDITVRDVADCDDSDPCTNVSCGSGTCAFTPIVCDDDDLCTTDACDPADGSCKYEAGVCLDGEVCDPSTGECVPCATDSGCDDGNLCTDGTCNSSGECVFTPNDTNSCDDSDMCNGLESCENGACVLGTSFELRRWRCMQRRRNLRSDHRVPAWHSD